MEQLPATAGSFFLSVVLLAFFVSFKLTGMILGNTDFGLYFYRSAKPGKAGMTVSPKKI